MSDKPDDKHRAEKRKHASKASAAARDIVIRAPSECTSLEALCQDVNTLFAYVELIVERLKQ